jgi:cyclophilin family peptidyl-prolyl cis-trans isomerase/HEAT repeat protein
MSRLFILAIIVFGCSCSFRKDTNKFSDPALVQIADFQDRRQTDSLYQFLKSANPIYRREAALAFASVQDTLASSILGNILLEDLDAGVRQAAAFALGQTGGFVSVNSLIPAASDKEVAVVSEVLEALGKTIEKKDSGVLIHFKAKDSLTQIGLARGFYHLGLRGLADSTVINHCRKFLNPAYNLQARLAAAHFFNRSLVLPGQNYEAELIQTATEDPNVYVRMAAASALRKITSKKSLEAIKRIISTDPDYRVRCNGIRALSAFAFEESQEELLTALDDKNINVGIAASEVIRNKATAEQLEKIVAKARSTKNWRIQANLYGTVLSLSPTKEFISEVESAYVASTSNYQKSGLLGALAEAIGAYPFIRDELIQSKILVVKSSAAQALVEINRHVGFSPALKNDFSSAYRRAITDGDPGVIVSIAGALGDSVLDYRSAIKDFNFLYEARNKLSLPKDIEALQPLKEAIAYFEGKKKPSPPKNAFNHPINWELVKTISRDQRVLLKTSKGDIMLRLMVDEAPGSVANFIELCNQKYFDGKFFHRVVPNFVVQAGCNRGDGYGSEAYSIRSEFSGRRYTEGSVGMASAGKDTEGTQWFITHSPTPHLDGKYTVFAEVEHGMDVVHRIEVGDQVVSASLITELKK